MLALFTVHRVARIAGTPLCRVLLTPYVPPLDGEDEEMDDMMLEVSAADFEFTAQTREHRLGDVLETYGVEIETADPPALGSTVEMEIRPCVRWTVAQDSDGA